VSIKRILPVSLSGISLIKIPGLTPIPCQEGKIIVATPTAVGGALTAHDEMNQGTI